MNIKELLYDIFVYRPEAPLLFNSFEFLVLGILVLGIYATIYRHKRPRTLFLLAFSLFFYYKTSGIFVLLLLGTLVAVYLMTRRMSLSEGRVRKWWLVGVITVVLGVLAYFKYANFLGENFCWIIGREFHRFDILLPVGISFYSFQLLSYAIDVYRRELEEERDFLDYAFYITFFPQLVAGPIVRAKSFLPQLKQEIVLNRNEIEKGFFLIMMGLFKKSILADYLSQYNDLVFANPGAYSGVETLMAIYGYAIQIYCDFSGYTDMAIGMGKMMGFDLGINFNKPYQSTSLTDFWRRWHISLSSWLRDYLYIPLGGNRKGKVRTYINLLLTMLIGGLWHGANWKFVFWGGMHGVGLIVDKLWQKLTKGKLKGYRLARIAGWFITLHFVIFLWIFFRADSFAVAWEMIGQVFSSFDLAYFPVFVETRKLFVLLLVLAVAIHAIPSEKFGEVERAYIRTPFLVKAIAFIILVQCILQIKSSDVQPFIYFQF